VHCHSVVVLGRIDGGLHANYVEIRPSGRISGDVYYEVLEVHQGSEVNGRLLHQAVIQEEPEPKAEG